MNFIHIIGNSGAAKECYWIVQELFDRDFNFKNSHKFMGFFSWDNYSGNLGELYYMEKKDLNNYDISPDDIFIIGIGNTRLRKDVFTIMKKRGARFMNLVHPLANICPSASIGEGNIFQRHSSIYANAVCGNANYFNGYVNISHDAIIGNYNFFAPYSISLGNSFVGNLNQIGPHSVILNNAKLGNENIISPGSVVYKGCKNNCRMIGNPAFCI